MSLGALGDSFYEYLIKRWIYQGHRTAGNSAGREAFDEAMVPVRRDLILKSQPSGLTFVAEAKGRSILRKMGHLVREIFTARAVALVNTPCVCVCVCVCTRVCRLDFSFLVKAHSF